MRAAFSDISNGKFFVSKKRLSTGQIKDYTFKNSPRKNITFSFRTDNEKSIFQQQWADAKLFKKGVPAGDIILEMLNILLQKDLICSEYHEKSLPVRTTSPSKLVLTVSFKNDIELKTFEERYSSAKLLLKDKYSVSDIFQHGIKHLMNTKENHMEIDSILEDEDTSDTVIYYFPSDKNDAQTDTTFPVSENIEISTKNSFIENSPDMSLLANSTEISYTENSTEISSSTENTSYFSEDGQENNRSTVEIEKENIDKHSFSERSEKMNESEASKFFVGEVSAIMDLVTSIENHARQCDSSMTIFKSTYKGHVLEFILRCENNHEMSCASSSKIGNFYAAIYRMNIAYVASGMLEAQYTKFTKMGKIGSTYCSEFPSIQNNIKAAIDVELLMSTSEALHEEKALNPHIDGIRRETDARHAQCKNSYHTDVVALHCK